MKNGFIGNDSKMTHSMWQTVLFKEPSLSSLTAQMSHKAGSGV